AGRGPRAEKGADVLKVDELGGFVGKNGFIRLAVLDYGFEAPAQYAAHVINLADGQEHSVERGPLADRHRPRTRVKKPRAKRRIGRPGTLGRHWSNHFIRVIVVRGNQAPPRETGDEEQASGDPKAQLPAPPAATLWGGGWPAPGLGDGVAEGAG